jgi:L-lactate dehydrogenase complex protein LldF
MSVETVKIARREGFAAGAHDALKDTQLRRNIQDATRTIRDKRAAVVAEVPDWEALRATAALIKDQAMAGLDRYLVDLERAVEGAGGRVHWARDAAEANRIIVGLARDAGAAEVVKVKSMTTEEIGLNVALAAAGIVAHETDLAEAIVQLGEDAPSHILVPAIHRNRAEIRALFRRTMGEPDITDAPEALTAAARRYLRARFLRAKVAISGANFACADNGAVVVVESEGNGRMCLTLPETLITVMGIEKVLPRFADLSVFLQLLPRSSTGERMNPYTSVWTGTHTGDGPRHFHLVLLDNGRTDVLADRVGRTTLRCIRCSACMNSCPVYGQVGGHAYGSVYPGPIGAILTPQLMSMTNAAANSLPYASTLCGACAEVCPVGIPIPEILVHLRGRVVAAKQEGPRKFLDGENLLMRTMAGVFANEKRFAAAQRLARAGQFPLARDGVIGWLPPPLAGWTRFRDLKAAPTQSFRDWWKARR